MLTEKRGCGAAAGIRAKLLRAFRILLPAVTAQRCNQDSRQPSSTCDGPVFQYTDQTLNRWLSCDALII
jgi:hypothetical protein